MANEYKTLGVRLDGTIDENEIMHAIKLIKGVEFVGGEVKVYDQWSADSAVRFEYFEALSAVISNKGSKDGA